MNIRVRNSRKLSLMVLSVLLVGLSLGFAYLSTTLNIKGTTGINNVQWDIYFDNIHETDGSVETTTAATIDDSKTSVSYGVFLEKPGDFYEFTVDAINNGSLDGMIETISFKLNDTEITSLPEYLEYKVSYSSGKKIEKNHLLKAFDNEVYKVRVAFKENVSASQLPSQKQNLEFNFGITYKQADENGIEVLHTFADFLGGLNESHTVITDDGTVDHNMRYIGSTPNNYVTFNGEEWRVIGLFNNVDDGNNNEQARVKIIKAEPYVEGTTTEFQWHTSNVNIWDGSSLNTKLQSLSYAANSMVDDAVWYLGDPGSFYIVGAKRGYEAERSSKVASGNAATWTGKVGLMYPSDYGFSSSECKDNYANTYNDATCTNSSWIYAGFTEWFISPESTGTTAGRYMTSNGNINPHVVSYTHQIRPVVYLKVNVACDNCSDSTAGTKSNPFRLA